MGVLITGGGGGAAQTPWLSDINADGFTLFGDDSSGGDLTLRSTSHATLGSLIFESTGATGAVLSQSGSNAQFKVANQIAFSSDAVLGVGTITGNTQGTGIHGLALFPASSTTSTSSNVFRGIAVDPVFGTVALGCNFIGFNFPNITTYELSADPGDITFSYVLANNTVRVVVGPAGGISTSLFVNANVFETTDTDTYNVLQNSLHTFGANPVFHGNGSGVNFVTLDNTALEDFQIFKGTGGGIATVWDSFTVLSEPWWSSGSGHRLFNRTGWWFKDVNDSQGGSGTVDWVTLLEMENQTYTETGWTLKSYDEDVSMFHEGKVLIGGDIATTTLFQSDIEIDDTEITLTDSSGFTASGFVQVINPNILGQNHFYEYTANDTGTGVLTLATPAETTVRGDGSLVRQLQAPDARLHVKSKATTEITSIFQAIASQTANISEWRSSAGDPLLLITAAGALAGGDDASDVLTIKSTTNATLGSIVFESTGATGMNFTQNGLGAGRLIIGGNVDPSSVLLAGGAANFFVEGETVVAFGAYGALGGDASSAPNFFGLRSRGTIASPLQTNDGDNFLNFGGSGYTTAGTPAINAGAPSVSFLFLQDGNPDALYVPGSFNVFTTNQSGTFAQRVRVRHDGKTGIGDALTPLGRLHVKGTGTTEITSIFQAVASQSVNLTEWQNSAAGVLASVDETGILTLGLAGTQTGTMLFNGTTSGTVTFKVADAAGTWSLTLPTTDGNANEVLITDGSGVTSWANKSTLKLPTPLFDHFANVSTTSVDGTENDLYTDTVAAAQLATDGDVISEIEEADFVASATAARRLKKYFGGTLIFDSSALTLSLGGVFQLTTTLIRESSTVVRVTVSVTTTSASSVPYTTYTRITGLTLSNTQILKTTGIASGTGAASGDIVNRMAKIMYQPAA